MSANSHYHSGLTEAQHWANALVMREIRCPSGDLENAMRRLEVRRPPADVMVGLWRQLHAAYENECKRQERLLAHERHVAEAAIVSFETLDSAPVKLDEPEGDK